MRVRVTSICLGYLRENCYLLEKNQQYLLVDPGEEIDKILRFINGKDIKGILVTHHHFDHVNSLEELVRIKNIPVFSYDSLDEGVKNIGVFQVEVIFTPGHTEDSVCYYFRDDKVMITGDFLFKGTVGRCDLEGGDYQEMINSIKKIKEYDDDITIYPGHGESSLLGYEKRYNPYFEEMR